MDLRLTFDLQNNDLVNLGQWSVVFRGQDGGGFKAGRQHGMSPVKCLRCL